jgi:hypothetical protein
MDVKISALTAVGTASTGDEIPVNQAGTTKKLTSAQLVELGRTETPRCKCYNSANVTAGTPDVVTAVNLDTEVFDVGGMHSTSVNTSRITAVVAGVYWACGGLRTSVTATGGANYIVALRKNGTDFLAQTNMIPGSSSHSVSGEASTLVTLAASDYVELVYLVTATTTFAGGGVDSPRLELVRVG